MITPLHRSDQGGCQWKRILGAGFQSWRHDGVPVGVERVHKFAGGFDQVFGDTSLGHEVHEGQEQERLVRCAMISDFRVPIPAPVGPMSSEHLDVFLKHPSERTPPDLVRFC